MSLRLKTILGVGLIEATLLIILITTVLNYMRVSSEQSLENYVSTTSRLFTTTTKDAVLSFDLASLETFIEEILKNQGVVYTRIFDANNNILASGHKPDYEPRLFKVDDSYQTVDDAVYDTETLITINNVIYGRIEMGFSTQTIEASLTEAQKLAAGIAVLEMVLVALFSLALGVYLTNQLKVLRNSAKDIAAGNLDHTININSRDEIGELAASFNKMIISLKEAQEKSRSYHQELLELNRHLEQRVDERTQKITEQKDKLEEAYEKLQLTQDQLLQSEKMASIGQLAAGVAHEINNPVAFVKSNLNSLNHYVRVYQQLFQAQSHLINELPDDLIDHLREQKKAVNSLQEEVDIEFINEDIVTLLNESIDGTERVEEIVKGLKIYSRASDDVVEDCDINSCLQDTLKMLNNELKHKCTVATHFNTLPLCACNRSKITQVFTNLIVNATHAMEEFGTLTIETRTDIRDEKKWVIIVITDTGKGIEPDHLPKLFDPFFTTKPVGQGTGLGLSISQSIIHDYGGSIEVESEVNHGTSFTIMLPAK